MISVLDDTLLALADPARRRILEVLLAGEASAAEIALAVGLQQRVLSRHVTILEGAGLISRRQQDDKEMIAANPEPLETAAEWINTNRELWAMRLQMQEISPGPGDGPP